MGWRSTRRHLVRYCVDWSEHRIHLGGWLGVAVLQRLVDLWWVVRAERRVVRVTRQRPLEAAEAGPDAKGPGNS